VILIAMISGGHSRSSMRVSHVGCPASCVWRTIWKRVAG
jgi:hypothetical protein